MPEHIRALVYILMMGAIGFAYGKQFITGFTDSAAYARRRNAWFLLTTIAFLIGNFWVYGLVLFLYMSAMVRREKNLVALYFFLLFVLPSADAFVPGFGLINYLIGISHQKLLVLFVLIPAIFRLGSKKVGFRFGSTLPDKILIVYFIYSITLYLRDTEFTNALRYTVTSLLVMVLPYYAISRYLRDMSEFRDATMSLLIATFVTAVIAALEFFKHWLLYSSISGVMGLSNESSYLGRAGMVRAMGPTGSSLALGFLITISMGLYLYYRNFSMRKSAKNAGWLALGFGHIAALSRGPWLGTLFMAICFTMTGRAAIKKLFMLFVGLILTLGVLSITPAGHKVIDLLPYIGNVDSQNITFRETLYTNSMIVIKRNPWTGSPNYLDEPEIQAMYNGFVIDIVNTYLALALSSGIIGMGLFTAFFSILGYQILKALRSIQDKSSEAHFLGRALFSTLCGMLFILVTTSPVGMIPTLYWAMSGICAGYIRMVKLDYAKQKNLNQNRTFR